MIFRQRHEKREQESSACNWGKSLFWAEETANVKSLGLEGDTEAQRGGSRQKGKEREGGFL